MRVLSLPVSIPVGDVGVARGLVHNGGDDGDNSGNLGRVVHQVERDLIGVGRPVVGVGRVLIGGGPRVAVVRRGEVGGDVTDGDPVVALLFLVAVVRGGVGDRVVHEDGLDLGGGGGECVVGGHCFDPFCGACAPWLMTQL